MKILKRLFHRKKETLTPLESAELRKWCYETSSFVKDYYRYCEAKNVPTIPKDVLTERLERSEQMFKWLTTGHSQ